MKRLLLIAMFSIAIATAQAQLTRVYAFGSGGVEANEGLAYQFGGASVWADKWIISTAFLNVKRNADLPSDFKVHSGTGYPGLEYGTYPQAETKFLYASAGRYIRYSRRIHFILDAGLGMANGDVLSFRQGRSPVLQENKYSPNYCVTYSDKTSIGSIIRAGVDVSLANFTGIGFDLYYNYNGGGLHSNFGLNVRLIMGKTPMED
ncbi:MAG TPA: hypothetical protein VFX73_02980 [Chitinophagaceae bacterium]|nr:hypothetical protein [Chitinophagaceae bacterium]